MNEKNKEPTVKADVAMPLGFTDAVKAVREALGLLGDVTAKVKTVSEAHQRRRGKKAASDLDTLAFRSDGSRKHLENIASGKAKAEDFERIAKTMERTGGQVEEALDRLRDTRAFIRKRFGARVANKIDDMIYAGGGKQSIRRDLELLARMDHETYSVEEIALEAQGILSRIELLNEQLAEVHDLLAGVSQNRV